MGIRLVVTSVLVIFLILVGLSIKLYLDLGSNIEITPTGEEFCKPVLGVDSSEDIVIDTSNGTAFISSLWRRNTAENDGQIYSYSINSDDSPRIVSPELEFSFRPLGLGFLEAGDDRFLFAVNRRGDSNCIERFRINLDELIHEESFCRENFHSANDVLPISESSFYLTNDHGSTAGLGYLFEDLTGIGRGEVVFFDGFTSLTVADGISYANGIAMNPEGDLIYVAATRTRQLRVYRRQVDSNLLELVQVWDTGTGVDNINVDSSGNLWIGSHPDLLAFLDYSKNPKVLSPSQVIRVDPFREGNFVSEDIYLSEGDYLSGSSAAAIWQDTLLIGSVFDQRFLVCRIPEKEREPLQ